MNDYRICAIGVAASRMLIGTTIYGLIVRAPYNLSKGNSDLTFEHLCSCLHKEHAQCSGILLCQFDTLDSIF